MYYKSHPLSTTYFQTTYKTDNVCSDIIQPKTHEQLIEIICTLNFRDQTYHVVSSGQNLGYGGRIPEENVDYLIDLQHLKNIHVDKQKAIATIQAGVTQTELFNHLVANDLEFFFHVSGAPADTSILGNALTGGYANGVNSIRFDRILALKGVYHDGTEFNTLTKSNTKYTDQADQEGNKDYFAILVTKQPIEYDNINKAINRAAGSSYAQKVNNALGSVLKKGVNYQSNGQSIGFSTDTNGEEAVLMIIGVNKQ